MAMSGEQTAYIITEEYCLILDSDEGDEGDEGYEGYEEYGISEEGDEEYCLILGDEI